LAENFIQQHFQGDKTRFALFAKGLGSKEELVSQLQELGITKKLEVTEILGAVKEVGGLQGTFSHNSSSCLVP
jgi:hypothetical protein